MKNKYLTEKERYKIEIYLNEGYSVVKIAEMLGRSFKTIYNEIKRGSVVLLNSDLTEKKIYCADVGQRVRQENGYNKGKALAIGNNIQLADRIEHLIIDNKYSPYSALEVCKREGLNVNICLTTLYSYIHKKIFYKLSDKHLLYYNPKKKKQDKETRVNIKNLRGTSIDERDKDINSRNKYGHWEIDTVVGKQGTTSCLFVLTERMTREQLIFKRSNKTIDCCVDILNRLEIKYADDFSKKFKTITCDNGVEFLGFERMEKSLLFDDKQRVKVYYCHPYRSNERGTNENQNRIIRRFIPKGVNIANYDDDYIASIQDYMNNIPRKIFNGKTALEMVNEFGFV